MDALLLRRTLMATTAAMFRRGMVGAQQVVAAAVELLAAGEDDRTLAALAGVPAAAAIAEVGELLPRAMAAVGLPLFEEDDDESQILAAAGLVDRYRSGGFTARELAERAHRQFRHQGPAPVEVLVLTDDAYDVVWHAGGSVEDVDPEVEAAADAVWQAAVAIVAAGTGGRSLEA